MTTATPDQFPITNPEPLVDQQPPLLPFNHLAKTAIIAILVLWIGLTYYLGDQYIANQGNQADLAALEAEYDEEVEAQRRVIIDQGNTITELETRLELSQEQQSKAESQASYYNAEAKRWMERYLRDANKVVPTEPGWQGPVDKDE